MTKCDIYNSEQYKLSKSKNLSDFDFFCCLEYKVSRVQIYVVIELNISYS
jgi:hypothetical protein